VANDYPHSEDEPASTALDNAREFEGEMVLNSYDIDFEQPLSHKEQQ
jgi:hypothetical protein